MDNRNYFLKILFLFLCVQQIWCRKNDEHTESTVKVGEYIVLECDIDFPQNIMIPHILQWKKDKELIFSWTDNVPKFNENFENRIHLLNEKDAWRHGRGSINLTSIRETDEGWYECKVIFPNRTPSSKPNGTWYHLIVEGGNLLAIPPTNETVMEGEPAKLKCVSKQSSSTVIWYKDEQPITDISSLKERVSLSPEGSLNIFKTDMKDSGYYCCEVIDENGEKQAAGAYLNVQFKAKVVYAPRRVYLPHGKPGHLECYYKANPEITKIRWEKDGFLFDAYNVPGVSARKNGSLYFNKIDDSHAGEYTCTPYNDLGTNGPSPRMNVIVQHPPTFTITPRLVYLRKTGESVVMHCDAMDGEGVDKPTIAWNRKNGVEIPPNRSTVSGGNLTITNIEETDRGYYQCIATNEAATISSEAELIVENMRSHAPYNVTAEATNNSIKVKWLPGFVKPKLEYSIWYRSEDTTEWKTIPIDSTGSYEILINELNPETPYVVMILSQDENGDGMFSKTVRITTKGVEKEPETEILEDQEFRSPIGLYQQIGPPYDLYVQVLDNGYKIIWKPPKHGIEMLKYYTVVWYKEPHGEKVGVIETHENHAIIRSLEPGTSYRIQVFAMSTNDFEAASLKYIFHVPIFHQKGAVFVGIAGGVLILSIILAIVWYIRHKVKKYYSS